jgi:hypothetical protein
MIEKYPAIPEIAKAVPNNIAANIIEPLTYLQNLTIEHDAHRYGIPLLANCNYHTKIVHFQDDNL